MRGVLSSTKLRKLIEDSMNELQRTFYKTNKNNWHQIYMFLLTFLPTPA